MSTALRLLNDWQHGFPLLPRPFEALGAEVGCDGAEVLRQYRALRAEGSLSRIGGVFAAGAGGAAALCAYAVPPQQLEAVAALVSAHAGVNHNYEREHRFNLWFVMTGSSRAAVEAAVAGLDVATGLTALRLPMLRAYRIDLGFDLLGATRRGAGPARATTGAAVEAIDRPLAALAGEGLPLADEPYAAWAAQLGRGTGAVLGTLRGWLARGTLRRFGVVVRHHELGFDQNAMCVFDVPDAQVDAAGALLARQDGVTLCYRRARAPGWPFNLYAMVHGRERAQVLAQVEAAAAAAGLLSGPRAVLFSRRRFTQRGARYFGTPQELQHA
ncbi:siroheme decarboxylase subunit beta [Azohydromonas caseinilytica]|uniref:siroheme decarboxylase n=1 Tax=Azohydromonas caseinilytica TaxID=2728836 RepID=A0A848F5A9_9BURK|nr:Lrp/AsnC family transcriptional regulator [Azohydromonas caseinilytica]NML15237.1 Lrp/AsnC family transcriptional regulator [Azohydromonas caseinilytica]